MRTAEDLSPGVRELVVDGREAWRAHDYDRAEELLAEAVSLANEQGNAYDRMSAYHFLGNVTFNQCRDAASRRFHVIALEIARADDDDQGVATSLGSIALVDVAEGNREAARTAFADCVSAYLRAAMPEAADRARETATALLDQGVPLESLIDRRPSGPR